MLSAELQMHLWHSSVLHIQSQHISTTDQIHSSAYNTSLSSSGLRGSSSKLLALKIWSQRIVKTMQHCHLFLILLCVHGEHPIELPCAKYLFKILFVTQVKSPSCGCLLLICLNGGCVTSNQRHVHDQEAKHT
jgi:hypothetical protein